MQDRLGPDLISQVQTLRSSIKTLPTVPGVGFLRTSRLFVQNRNKQTENRLLPHFVKPLVPQYLNPGAG